MGDIKGRKMTAYMDCGPEVKLAGADYIECAPDKAVVDGNIVTSPTWLGHAEALKEFIKLLGCKI